MLSAGCISSCVFSHGAEKKLLTMLTNLRHPILSYNERYFRQHRLDSCRNTHSIIPGLSSTFVYMKNVDISVEENNTKNTLMLKYILICLEAVDLLTLNTTASKNELTRYI